MAKYLVMIQLLTLLSACGKGVNPDEMLGVADIPSPPVLEEITYSQGGNPIVVKSPFPSFLSVTPDFGTGTCLNSAEITFKGTFDSEKTKDWQVSGSLSFQASTSANQFTITACLPAGGSILTVKTLDAKGSFNPHSPQLSLSISGLIQTIGFGHPTYPQPGFRMLNASPKSALSTSSSVQLKNLAIGDVGGKEIISNNQPTMTMSIGFVQVLSKTGQ